jgi:hypothetical protein
MRGSAKLIVFSMLFIVVYTLCFFFNVALFKYYPMVREFHVDSQGKAAGPPISWYGWLAVAALVSGAVALAVPGRLASRIPPAVSWVVPLVVLVTVLVYEKRWFL